MAKTSTERSKDRALRMKAAGFKLLRNFWVQPCDEAELRRVAEMRQRKRAKLALHEPANAEFSDPPPLAGPLE